MNNRDLPLVSVAIPNFNYGHYLENCLESVFNQTYPNIEISFNDNQSTDNSYEIAYNYRRKFIDKGIYFHLYQNKRNLGSDINSKIATSRIEGSFLYTLASDDAIAPDFIEKCMNVFINYPKVGTVMTHREEMYENGDITQTVPFYNKSFVIDGESQAAVYMMAGIGIPGQRMIRRSLLGKIGAYQRTFQVAGDWYDNFLYTMAGDFAYICEPLCRYRVHLGNETNVSERNILGVIEHFQIINAFKSVADSFGMKKPAARYDEAVSKLGGMCLRYAHKMLQMGLDDAAFRYLKLAPVFKIDIESEELYKYLMKCFQLKGDQRNDQLSALNESGVLRRTCSYEPPEGYITL
jgi:glycosyltransferase involved in cell wall biosynthesis